MTTRLLFLVTLFCLIGQFLSAQSIWTDIKVASSSRDESSFPAKSFRTLALDIEQFQELLLEKDKPSSIDLPLPNGELLSFEIQNSPIIDAALAAKYPSIQTFIIKNKKYPAINGRMNYTPNGLKALIHHPLGMFVIEPLEKKATNRYASYFTKDLRFENKEDLHLSCGHSLETNTNGFGRILTSSSRENKATVDLTVYRLVLSSTGEFAEFHEATTKEEILFEFVDLLTFTNTIFERDFAIRFELIAETEAVIFLDPETDPYIGDRSVFSLAEQSSVAIESRINVNNFDIGHILTADCFTGGGAVGVVTGPACTFTKSQGVSCQFQRNTLFATGVFAHELGHQFSASHSWSNCPGSEGQRSGTPYEPGSGSTIMSYAGACGVGNNIQLDSDPYFHVANIEEIERFQIANAGCGTNLSMGNTAPEAVILQEEGLFIPIQTPFELKGEGIDEDGDDLTYCWEQFDLGPATPLSDPRGNSPTFRSFPPNSNSNRIIPRLDRIINNNFDNTEVLPTFSRDLTFRLTVRDNFIEGGGVDWAEISFKATEDAGPFRVLFPNAGTDVVRVGESVDVQWDVANTDTSPVDCQKVDIYLSIDGGFTYPEELILAREVDNDGSQVVTIPELTTNTARIKVAAADNIFFDISNNDFDILNPTQSGFSFSTSVQSKDICLPEIVEIDLNTVSLLGYEEAIIFDIVEGLPEGATATFQNNATAPGTSNLLRIDFQNVQTSGGFDVIVRGIAPNADTISRTIEFSLTSNDFSDLRLMTPPNNTVGLSAPNYTWIPSQDAITYNIEIATSPTFGNTVIDRAQNLRTPNYPSTKSLDPNTIYYWRVIPSNECGAGSSPDIFAFQTERFVCSSESSNNVPLFISRQGTPTLQSTLNIAQSIEISDLNVVGLVGRHDLVRHIAIRLISPSGTTVTLVSNQCFTIPIDLNFDDESLIAAICPANDGRTKMPQEPLSAFDGEDAFGQWILEVEVLSTEGEGGSIEGWGLEICTNASIDPPMLVNNNLLPVQPTKGRVITNEFLLSEDANNTTEELIYTVIATPVNGTLQRNGVLLTIGATFTQADLDNELVIYNNETGSNAEQDAFQFDVTDGEGGWIGITSFAIVLDESETTTSSAEIDFSESIAIFPNPTKDVVYISLPDAPVNATQIRLFNSQGQLLGADILNVSSNQLAVDLSSLSTGVYFFQVQMEDRIAVKKVVVQAF